MSFTTTSFAYFLPIFAVLWLMTAGRYRWQLGVMLLGSLVFYSYNRWWTLAIILAYCLVDWGAGLLMQRTRQRKLVLATGLAFNLSVLAFWKYTPLAIQTAITLGAPLTPIDGASWTIPFGISFFSFTGIAYMVDVYRGVTPAETSFWRYALFTSFFPHLVAGPILRAREFLVELGPEHLPARPQAPWEATFLIARGLFKKLVLADTIAAGIDPFFANISDVSTAGVWALPYVWLYALQIYFDFSGYTDIARGLGLWFGFRWPENFNWPYLATSIQDFWRRWHMTLSRFLRDYLYIPLGGNRHGPVRAAINLMITMLLGGLWHGGSWSFLVWGGLHGAFLVINRIWGSLALQQRLAQMQGAAGLAWTAFRIALTFHAVCFAWCFFRLTDIRESFVCVTKWFVFDRAFAGGSADPALWTLILAYCLTAAVVAFAAGRLSLPAFARTLSYRPLTHGLSWGAAGAMLCLALLLAPRGQATPFIYFQF